jgi:hypothetical protein
MTLYTIHLTETISVTDLRFCKHEDLHTAWERKSISSILTEIKGKLVSFIISEATIISEAIKRRLARRIIETINIIGSLGKGVPIGIAETTAIISSISTLKDHLTVIILNEIPVIMERLIANTAGPSFRWRFQPWKKSSMDNEFEPPRQYPHINITGPVGEAIKMVNVVIRTRLPYIFKFNKDNES